MELAPMWVVVFEIHCMFRHNLLIILRNAKRSIAVFAINVVGLASGLACALLIYLWVTD